MIPGELIHSASYSSKGVMRPNYIWKWSIHCSSLSSMFTPLHSSTNQKLFEKHLCNTMIYDGTACPQLLSETKVSIMLHCQLCSNHYTAVQIKNCSKSTSVIKVATMKYDSTMHPSYHLKLSIRRTLAYPWRIYCGMPKGTSQTEATLNGEKKASP